MLYADSAGVWFVDFQFCWANWLRCERRSAAFEDYLVEIADEEVLREFELVVELSPQTLGEMRCVIETWGDVMRTRIRFCGSCSKVL